MKISMQSGQLVVPDSVDIPFIEGDGTGPDIWSASRVVFDAAVKKAFGGRKKVNWVELLAGEKAVANGKELLPSETLEQIKSHFVAIKGPLTTPVGTGFRSINVTLRQELDLYACVRPVKWFKGVPAPVKSPQDVNIVIFRENTEDVYAGLEWQSGSEKAQKLVSFLNGELGCKLASDAAIGIKPMTKRNSQRLVRAALKYAVANKRRSVTLVHKGNIMKYTEGAFKDWGYSVATSEFGGEIVTESAVVASGASSAGKILINDRIADNMFQQMLLRPSEYDVIATPNLNGDYLSDAAAAQVGGLGIAPGGNINYETGFAVFEATHGSAPKYAGQDKVNPGSVILSGAMLFEYLGWSSVAKLIESAMEEAIVSKKVTYDFHRQIEGATLLKCSEFAGEIANNVEKS
ncbi:MAG: isocitrate dehydrogenase (NADP(+)) [Candidatus Micrarchaeota archaeon]|nr:isocitrate dehydrogenase (NADP(+)) [Candidatus Micrarchaeota archaeon]